MSVRAYQQARTRSETPRDLEYRLFGQVTRALMEAAELPKTDVQGRMAALDWNRRLWTVLANDCRLDTNPLPVELRAKIVSLSLWVDRHTTAIMAGDEGFGPLIDVNKAMMQGLAPSAEASAA